MISPVDVAPKKDRGRRITWLKISRRRESSTPRAATSSPRRERYRKAPYSAAKRNIQETARTSRSLPSGAERPSIASRIIHGIRSPKRLETNRPRAHRKNAVR
jgi:hypothetical protein